MLVQLRVKFELGLGLKASTRGTILFISFPFIWSFVSREKNQRGNLISSGPFLVNSSFSKIKPQRHDAHTITLPSSTFVSFFPIFPFKAWLINSQIIITPLDASPPHRLHSLFPLLSRETSSSLKKISSMLSIRVFTSWWKKRDKIVAVQKRVRVEVRETCDGRI